MDEGVGVMVPELGVDEGGAVPEQLAAYKVMELSLSLSSVSIFAAFSLISPSSSSKLTSAETSAQSTPVSSMSLFPGYGGDRNFSAYVTGELSQVESALSLPLLYRSKDVVFIPGSERTILVSRLGSLVF